MTRTRSSSPGSTAGFTAFASELMFMTRTPCSSATRLRLKSLVRITRLRVRRERDELRVDLGLVGTCPRRSRPGSPVLLHAGQDLQPAPAAVPAQRVGGVGDVLELVEDEARDHERAVDEPRGDDVRDPPVDHRRRVDDDARLPAARGAWPRSGRRADEPTVSAAPSRSCRFATVRPSIPSPSSSETPSGSQAERLRRGRPAADQAAGPSAARAAAR